MRKIYLFVFSLISTISFSQQVVKKITPSQISLLALANGNSLPETCGTWNIDIGNSDNWGNISIYTNTNTIVSKSETVAVLTTLPNEVVGNSTFVWDSNTQSKTVYTLPNSYVSLSFFTKRGRGNCDADIGIEGIITTWDIPFTQTDGSEIPLGTKLRFDSPSITDLATGSTLVPNKSMWFEWYNNNWNAFFTNPVTGNPVAQLEDWGASLNLQNIEQLDNLKTYPNPVNDIVHISTPNETINQINVYDITGRLLKSQNGNNESEIISIQELPSAMYVLEVKTNKESRTKKIIKE
jgi:hypothetical protein